MKPWDHFHGYGFGRAHTYLPSSILYLFTLFHFVWVRLNLENLEEQSGMDEATSEDLAFPSQSRGNPTESGPRTV
jgi:hypothetical protein